MPDWITNSTQASYPAFLRDYFVDSAGREQFAMCEYTSSRLMIDFDSLHVRTKSYGDQS